MKVLINYANDVFRESQLLNSSTGMRVGGFDRVIEYGPADIDRAFAFRNRAILYRRRGNGYWLWKPYFIERTLRELNDGDYLFYCDAGTTFVGSIDPLIEIGRRDGQDLVAFELPFLEKVWTKRDALLLMGCDQPRFTDTRQRLASYSLWRRSAFTLAFAREMLTWSQDPRLLTDQPNRLGRANYPGFREHRHDQSIFSLLTKKYGLRAYRNPSQQGERFAADYPDSTYGQLIFHSRRKNPPKHRRLTLWYNKVKWMIGDMVAGGR